MGRSWFVACFAIAWLAAPAICGLSQDGPQEDSRNVVAYPTRDTLNIARDSIEDANACLQTLAWEPGDFDVQVAEQLEGSRVIEIQFASPKPCGLPAIDQVAVDWHAARDENNQLLVRPGIVVVHESGAGMHVGRLVATELARRGLHAFLVQLPGYGRRKSAEFQQADMIGVFLQGVADVRRARDAVAAIPQVDAKHIGLQGTSLGGFVATLAGSLDDKFDSNTLLLCGGDLHGVLTSGNRDAEKTLTRLLASGVSEVELKDALRQVEPLRIAHRMSPEKTWLYSGTFDQVVLPKYSHRLAQAIDLNADHHIQMLATHYSGVVFLPGVLEQIRARACAE
jgi:hypothetical protein